MEIPSTHSIATALRSTELAAHALPHRDHPSFEPGEMEYKRRLALKLAEALHACAQKTTGWRDLLVAAIRSKDNNIVPWQSKASFCTWIADPSSSARKWLLAANDPIRPPSERMSVFCGGMQKSGIDRLTQPGAQLVLGSIILMAGDPENCPPVRTDVVEFAIEELELDWPVRKATSVERYKCFLNILDGLIKHSQSGRIVLDNRLEAQGVVWCQKSGWMERSVLAREPFDADSDIDAAKKSLEKLSATEREAIVSARRGQGQFRRRLLNRWLACSVTNCTNPEILRASHLKPWRDSTNAERLSTANGLLLSPTLDALLDAFLISFCKDGQILISRSLSQKDRLALGIHQKMALRKVFADIKPFLDYHRAEYCRLERQRR